mgnify:CR=1 FL=1
MKNKEKYIDQICDFNIDFPMIKWENYEPRLIEDSMKLEVVLTL